MITGFSNTTGSDTVTASRHLGSGALPVPFNMPGVLYNLLFSELDLHFDKKQSDVIEALRYSYKALHKIQEEYVQNEQNLVAKMIQEPDNQNLKSQYENLQIDRIQAENDFKKLVEAISLLLRKEQYYQLLDYSDISN